jgi:hypothetical protein
MLERDEVRGHAEDPPGLFDEVEDLHPELPQAGRGPHEARFL